MKEERLLKDIPQIGFGFWKVAPNDCVDTLIEAVRAGYRHFDCAADYGNEVQVGEGIAKAMEQGLCTRDEIWVTSKLWNTFHAPEHVEMACQKSLDDLGLDSFDLYLIHFPIALEYVPIDERYPPEWVFDPSDANPVMKPAQIPLHETWAAMERLVEQGLSQNIGVCNYNSALLHDLMRYARIKPYALQIESHPYLSQEKLIRLANQYDMHVTAFSPLGALSYVELDMAGTQDNVLTEPAILAAADLHNKTPAQIVLRWGIQRGLSIIPKTTKPERMRENLAITDFLLNDQEMQSISVLNADRRFNDPGIFCEAAFHTFHPIYD